MKRNLRRILNADRPTNPKTPENVATSFENENIMNDYGYNLRRTENFYITTVTQHASSFTLFGSKEVMKMIEKFVPHNRKYLLDGTFDVTPVGFYQLLIIYIEYQNDVSPSTFPYIHPFIHPYSSDEYLYEL